MALKKYSTDFISLEQDPKYQIHLNLMCTTPFLGVTVNVYYVPPTTWHMWVCMCMCVRVYVSISVRVYMCVCVHSGDFIMYMLVLSIQKELDKNKKLYINA